MSILIKGMEMPPTCRYCAFRHLSISGNAFCTAANETIDYMVERTKRLDNCPLIELPPHGRLIDADALFGVMATEYKRIAETYGENDEYALCLKNYAISMVASAPTIIEADESIKQGEWEKHNDGIMYWWECSKCHHDAWYDEDELYNYCPWCGAKMTIIESEE